MNLKIKNVRLVWYIDLEKYVKHHLGQELDIQQGEYANGSLREFEVNPEFHSDPKYAKGNSDALADWMESGGLVDEELVLAELCRRNLLEAGNLYVHIWW